MSSRGLVAVTGASGFIGAHLSGALAASGFEVRALVRRRGSAPSHKLIDEQMIGDLSMPVDAKPFLRGASFVAHFAAPAGGGRMLREIHVDATKRLYAASCDVGAALFLYPGSVRAIAGESRHGAITLRSAPQPAGAYGRAKLVSERWLAQQLVGATRPVVLRLPAIYGEQAENNVTRLIRWVSARRPIPVPERPNLRSMLYVRNLADYVVRLLDLDSATMGVIQQISDGAAISTNQLVSGIGRAAGIEPRTWAVSPHMLQLLNHLPGVSAYLERLCGSLVLETSAAFSWQPPFSSEEGIERTVKSLISG